MTSCLRVLMALACALAQPLRASAQPVLQAEGLELHASVDRTRLSVGEALLYTLRAVSRSAAPVQVTIAAFTGFEIESRSERSEVATVNGAQERSTVLEVRLRAVQPGRWKVGPARAHAGGREVEAAAVTIDVAPDAAPGTVAVGPRLRELVLRAPLPVGGQPSVLVLLSRDSIRVGEQVDLVTAAWFPRELRLQLRRPPTLQPPVIGGVWTYPQATPPGIAITRTVGGAVYDLFMAHQIVFPLVPGTIDIAPATLKYSTTRALQFFSREERFNLTSNGASLAVAALPPAPGTARFDGAVGRGLTFERRIERTVARRGEPLGLEFVVEGSGNIALWPAPQISWPREVRAYPDRVDERVRVESGMIGGRKSFRFLVVADSGSVLRLPAAAYTYYDTDAARYETVALPSVSIPLAGGSAPAPSLALPPALLGATRPAPAWRVWHAIPSFVWALLMLLPPILGIALRPRRRSPLAAPAGDRGTDLPALALRIERALRASLPRGCCQSDAELEAAIVAGGGDVELARRITALRDKLDAARFGPRGRAELGAALSAEADAVLRRLADQPGRRVGARGRGRPLRRSARLLALVLALPVSRSVGQGPSAEQLYERGAMRAAADAFADRVAAEPAVAAHWYNLGNATYRLGQPARAVAAWLRAARLAPRNGTIRRALRLATVPEQDRGSWTWVSPLTPEELWLGAAVLWLCGWIGWLRIPHGRWPAAAALALGVALGAVGAAVRSSYRRPVAIVLSDGTMRLSPYGRAPAVKALESGSAVLIRRTGNGWLLVEASDGSEGWMTGAELAALGG